MAQQQTDLKSFDSDQQDEIKAGLAAGINVDIYAKPEYLAMQMHQIRLGLMDGLDVSAYADPAYDWLQMEQLRLGVATGIEYKFYADPAMDYRRMRQIRKGLEQGVNLVPFARLEAGILRELRIAISHKVGLQEYISQGYQVDQLEQIRLSLEQGIDIKPYIVPELVGPSIREIRLGLETGLDPAVYARIYYGWQQMREIRLGLENRVDIGQYANQLYDWQQMREIRLGLEEGLDVSEYKSLMYTAREMGKKRQALMLGRPPELSQVDQELQELPKIHVMLGPNHMEASVCLSKTATEGVTRLELMRVLLQQGVVEGFVEEGIQTFIRDQENGEPVVIAEGIYPVRGDDGWYEYFFDTVLDRAPRILEDGTADYQDIKWFELVEQGQKLAYYHEAKEGTPGCTVTGRAIPGRRGREQKVLKGSGFVLLDDKKTYIAAFNGSVELLRKSELVVSRLCVFEEITRTTGNVSFEGSVHVRGNVGAGARIYATEDVVVEGSVESATIKCGGDILLKQGANGGGQGLLEAGKNVSSRYLESIAVRTGGDVVVNHCLHCQTYAAGSIIVRGQGGVLVGGMAHALKGMQLAQAGNKMGIRTLLRLGASDEILHQRVEIKEKITEIRQEQNMLNHAYQEFQKKYPPEVRNTMDMYLKIERAIYTKKMELEQVYEKNKIIEELYEQSKSGKIVVNGILYEGVEVFVDRIRWKAFTVREVTVGLVHGQIQAFQS